MAGETGGRVEREWLTYRSGVLPPDASSVQVRETRRAFYGGAIMILAALMGAVGTDDVSEMDGVVIMAEIHDEMTAFLEDVKQGRA